MKREIEAERFGHAAPCAPYGICEDPSGRTGAQASGPLFCLPDFPANTVSHHSAAPRPRLFQKGIAY